MNRRDVLKLSLAAGGAGVLARGAPAQNRKDAISHNCEANQCVLASA
jgi:hypothetical protein